MKWWINDCKYVKIIYELQIKKWIWGNLCSNKVQCYLGSVSQVFCKPALRHDQLPVGLSAQFLEHCMGIADGMGSNPVQAWIFSGLIFHYCVNSVHCCEDCFHIHFFIRSSHIWSSHIHSHWSTKTTSYLHRSAHLGMSSYQSVLDSCRGPSQKRVRKWV